jgi:outer membrane protein TolC
MKKIRFVLALLMGVAGLNAADSVMYSSEAAPAAASDEIAARGPLKLTMRRAVQIATSPEGNTRVQLQLENLKQAKDRSREVLAGLLPDIESYVAVGSSVRSLAATGLSSLKGLNEVDGILKDFGLAPIDIPDRLGPFEPLDIRATANVELFNFSVWRRLKASHATVRATKNDVSSTDESVTAQVSKAYLNALRADADFEAAQADLDLSGAVLKQSEHSKEAGSGTGMDVTRSSVQLANDKQRLLVAKNDQTRSHLQLLRAMNLRLDTPIELVDKLDYKPTDTLSVEDAISQALANRPDLKSQLEQEDAAKLNASAVKYERLPSIVATANYGVIGPPSVALLPTRDYYGQVRIPIFDGGRRDARRAESFSQLRQARIKSADLRDQIELDVRLAMDSLRSADEQVKVAEDGLKLADREMAQARRRFDAGVAGSLEVSDASDKLQRARTNKIDAVFNHNAARIDLGQALGKTSSMID